MCCPRQSVPQLGRDPSRRRAHSMSALNLPRVESYLSRWGGLLDSSCRGAGAERWPTSLGRGHGQWGGAAPPESLMTTTSRLLLVRPTTHRRKLRACSGDGQQARADPHAGLRAARGHRAPMRPKPLMADAQLLLRHQGLPVAIALGLPAAPQGQQRRAQAPGEPVPDLGRPDRLTALSWGVHAGLPRAGALRRRAGRQAKADSALEPRAGR